MVKIDETYREIKVESVSFIEKDDDFKAVVFNLEDGRRFAHANFPFSKLEEVESYYG